MPDAAVSDLACDRLRVRLQLIEVRPTVPFAFAAESVWQPPQPALVNTFAPGRAVVSALELSLFLLPPQPATARRTSPRTARARMREEGTRHIEAEASEGAKSQPSPSMPFPRKGYSLTSWG